MYLQGSSENVHMNPILARRDLPFLSSQLWGNFETTSCEQYSWDPDPDPSINKQKNEQKP
jgi:hypothetical protein